LRMKKLSYSFIILFIAVIVSCLVFTNIGLCFKIFLFDSENESILKIDSNLFDDSRDNIVVTCYLATLFLVLVTIKKYLSPKFVELNYYVVSGTRAPPLRR